jgi:hypothetical protein
MRRPGPQPASALRRRRRWRGTTWPPKSRADIFRSEALPITPDQIATQAVDAGFTVHKAEERQHSAAEGECGRFHKLLVDDERANGAKHQPRKDGATAQRLQAGVENADAAELGERLRLFRPLMKSSDASGNTFQAQQSTSTISAHLAAVLAWINFSAHALAR